MEEFGVNGFRNEDLSEELTENPEGIGTDEVIKGAGIGDNDHAVLRALRGPRRSSRAAMSSLRFSTV